MLDFGQDEQLAFADPVDLVARVYADLRFPERVAISEAARRHRVLQNPGAYSGPWGDGPHSTRHLDRPMDCLGKDSPYREVAVMGPSQVGKSEIGNNYQLHAVLYDPADMLFIAPDRTLAEAYVKKEFDKMIELAVHQDGTPGAMAEKMLPGASSDTLSLKRFRGADFFFYWPSGGRLRALPFPRVRIDDLDEIPTDISDQGDAVSLGRGRMGSFVAYGQTMLYVNSSPKLGAGKGIEALVASGTDEMLWVDCLMCGNPFAFYADRLQFDDQGSVAAAGESAVVVCADPQCGGAHVQRDKRALLETARWVGRGETAVPTAESPSGKVGELEPNIRAGFRFDGLFGFRPWREIAEIGREAEIKLEYEQDDSALKAWDQTIVGRNYSARRQGETPVTEDELVRRAKASGYEMGEVPPGVQVLVASIDQQGNRFEVAVWGFGRDFRAWLVDRYQILTINRDGRQEPLRPFTRLEDWAVIHSYVMSQTYPLAGADHLQMKIFNTAIDTGGLDNATDNAFAWWHSMVAGDPLAGRAALPPTAITLIKGGNKPDKPLLPRPTVDAKRQIKGAPQAELFVPNVHRLKNIADNCINRRDDGPGFVQFPRDVPGVEPNSSPNYLAELRAEHKVDEVWVRPPHTPNETWDLYIYARAVLLRFGGNDGSLAWVPAWARAPRGAPESLPEPPEPEKVKAAEEPAKQPVVKLQKAVKTGRSAPKRRRSIRMRRGG